MRRFATHRQGTVTKSPVGDGVMWTSIPASPVSELAGYDPDHHLLYVVHAGMQRMVTE